MRYDSESVAAFDFRNGCLQVPARSSVKHEPFCIRIPNTDVCSKGDAIRYWKDDRRIAGFALAQVSPDTLKAVSEQLYRDLLEVCTDYSLYRIWNWIPQINLVTEGFDENYRLFCTGRAHAFSAVFGQGSEARMPAASGVGVNGDQLVVLFVGGTDPVEHLENPRQLPAYRYPPVYGPCPPSFSRASRICHPTGQWTFISGTAAIVQSESQCAGDLPGQIEVTLGNLAMLGVDFESPPNLSRFFRVYLRNWNDHPEVLRRLEQTLLRPEDLVVFVDADICRSDLLIEIEACFFQPSVLDGTDSL